MTRVSVVGVDGRPLGEWASDRVAAARLVLGADRHLQQVAIPASARRLTFGKLSEAIDAIRREEGPVVVLASGDPGFFGIVRVLRERGFDLEVSPAVSAVAAAFALIGINWDDAVVVSAHGRELSRALNVCRAWPKVAVLTGPGSGPAQIGAGLDGWPRRILVAERLGSPAQRLSECSPAQAAEREWAEPNLVVALGSPGPRVGWAAPARQVPARWALGEDDFEHRDGLITKAEVRAVALAQLGPGLGDLVWDVGCGSGALGVECARFGAAVIALDADPRQCDRARANGAAHGIDLRVLTGEAPGCLDSLPPPDAAFVGGGGVEVVAAVGRAGPRTVVAALAAVDRVAGVREVLRAQSYRVGGVALAANRFVDLPDGTTRLAATNPVFLVWGHR